MGLEHIDHRLTRRAALRLVRTLRAHEWWVYAEPLYRHNQHATNMTLSVLDRAGLVLAPTPPLVAAGRADRDVRSSKRRALTSYRSQQRPLLVFNRARALDQMAPEQYWRIEPTS
jgi:LmbE family N-acetylglucosaminyl deacetylase